MSRRAPRGSPPSSRQASRESSDQEDSEAFLTYSTPIAKRKHRQHHHSRAFDSDIDTLVDNNSSSNSNSNNSILPISHQRDHSTSGSSASGSMTVGAATASTGKGLDEISMATIVTTASEPLGIAVTAPAIVLEASGSSSRRQLQQQQKRQQKGIQKSLQDPGPAYSKWSTLGHQASFLATAGTTMLTVFLNYIGMMCVGLVYAAQSWFADRRQRRQAMAASSGRTQVEYDVLTTDMNEMSETHFQRDENHGVKDHIQLVGNRISSGSRHHKQHHTAMTAESSHHQLGHDHDSEEDSEDDDDLDLDEFDVERQRLRMQNNASASALSSSSGTGEKISWAYRMRLHWPVIQVAIMDVIANALVTIGFFYVGSGMYQVIYSSIVIWCAILTRIFLSRKLNNIQWLAILGVTFGLAVSAVGTVEGMSSENGGPVQNWLQKSFGALVTLGATFLYACVYVLSDKVLSTFEPKPVPEKVCAMVGGYASLLAFVYICVYTIPNWQTEVVDVVAAHHGSWVGIGLMTPLVVISSMLHSLNYYVLLSRINSVAVGIMQSLRAVLVFVMSHYLFCGVSSTQCFNEWKFISAIVVIGCVTLFSLNSAPTADTDSDMKNATAIELSPTSSSSFASPSSPSSPSSSLPPAYSSAGRAGHSTVIVKGKPSSRGASSIPRTSSTRHQNVSRSP
ncbi:hypothetical protein BGZ99_001072 [Dissophora globulifera]|uniref:Uncharacterized protein n=1 Tax=Dissophora globulifera TaxID=979702 RepID=A0A9P6UXZ8_9FUNG|nr:hypothetical protein BGZ99_001072 [Dissophora globulifera]